MSYSSGVSDTPLLGRTLGDDLAAATASHPGREALVDVPSGRRWTYTELDEDTRVLAVALLDRGVVPGDRVAIWAQNVPEWTLVMYAVARIGGILVNVNPAYRVHELEYVLTQNGTRTLITQVADARTDFLGIANEAAGSVAGLNVVALDTVPGPLGADAGARIAADQSFAHLMERGRLLLEDTGAKWATRLRKIEDEVAADDPVNLQYTSGTTGFPKGVTLSHHNILNNGFSIGELLGYTETDRVVLPVPFFHCFGMVIGTLAIVSHGACAVIPAASFDPGATLRSVEQEKATSLYGVPTMFIAELALPDFDSFDLRSLRTGVMAGSTCPVEVMREVIDRMHMTEVAICYGMTETSPVSTMTRRDDSLARRTETVGRAMPHVEIKIVDPVTGRTAPRGVKGEVCTRGYSVMLGYWEEPDKTAEAIDAARWMRTGDLGIMDEDGYVEVTGRIKDMVIRGGENVYPREIEEFFYRHPAIRDIQVVGVPDEKYGEELMAWIVLADGHESLTAEDLRSFAQGRLAHYKVPRYVELRNGFPMTVSGKVRKVELREEGARLVGGA
nr:AMP-binding protein [Brevibacterium yomogidense]